MLIPLLFTLTSAGAIVGLYTLFRKEQKNVSRYGERWRLRFDQYVEKASVWIDARLPAPQKYHVRHTLHYLINVCLEWALGLVARCERILDIAAKRNKATAKKIAKKHSHLDTLSTHKKEHALSVSEKKARKEAALEGDV